MELSFWERSAALCISLPVPAAWCSVLEGRSDGGAVHGMARGDFDIVG